MNLLISCIGKRGYLADFFRPHLGPADRIIGTANTAWTPGFRACDAAFIVPSAADEAYVPAVLELCERERIDAVICVEDFDLEKLARARDQFVERGVVPLWPSAEVVEMALDKYKTFEFLTAAGIPTPRTALHPDEASDFRYPMYVKPRRGSGSKQLFRARNAPELEVFFNYAPDMIIQEEVRGPELDIQLCADLEGQIVGICALRKRCMRNGETDQAETFVDPEVLAFGLRLGELIKGIGPMEIELVRHGEQLVVLEINTRFNGCYPVAHLAGADFPRMLVELVRDGRVEPDLAFEPGVVMLKDLSIVGGAGDQFFGELLRVEEPWSKAGALGYPPSGAR
jgi:carbamoyl-phosphate synthase large subunit